MKPVCVAARVCGVVLTMVCVSVVGFDSGALKSKSLGACRCPSPGGVRSVLCLNGVGVLADGHSVACVQQLHIISLLRQTETLTVSFPARAASASASAYRTASALAFWWSASQCVSESVRARLLVI